MPQNVFEGGTRLNFTTTDSSIVANGPSKLFLLGVFVSQASSNPTLKVADSVGTIANTFTPLPGQFYAMPCQINGTLTLTVGGTLDATAFYGTP